MTNKVKIKRLKIVEQIIIVLFFAIIVPMAISAIIINNINQHAVRNELRYSALIISESIASNIQTFFQTGTDELDSIILSLKYIKSDYSKDVYLKDILVNSENFRALDIVDAQSASLIPVSDNSLRYNDENNTIEVIRKINNLEYLRAVVNMELFNDKVFNIFSNDERQIYVLNSKKELIIAHNYNQPDFEKIINLLPRNLKDNESTIFGDVKNQPLSYYKMQNPNTTVIVNTTHRITQTTINNARLKIILALVVSAVFILTVVLLYTYYLYINIRQLFKGITALSKGNYKRKVRLLANVFTPYEIIFLALEFNKMADEINTSYRQLKSKNRELKKLDEFRSNLIDTVSHEFRTPLTSIKGYASRLLRQDIEIDKETTNKSLKVIRTQSERLSRMVDDLLVIPDIEGAKLNLNIEPVEINALINLISEAMLYVKNSEQHEVIYNIEDNFPHVLADKDRFLQVLINLAENAHKYSYENTPLKIDITKEGQKAIIRLMNESDYIPPDVLSKLFGKFVRIDDKTTRTTRGTGLGLFIVKGLVLAMNGSIEIQSSPENVFVTTLKLPLYIDSNKF